MFPIVPNSLHPLPSFFVFDTNDSFFFWSFQKLQLKKKWPKLSTVILFQVVGAGKPQMARVLERNPKLQYLMQDRQG